MFESMHKRTCIVKLYRDDNNKTKKVVIVKQADLESLVEVALPQVPILGILGFEGVALDLIGTKNALYLTDGVIDSVVFFKLLGIVACTKQMQINSATLATALISAESSEVIVTSQQTAQHRKSWQGLLQDAGRWEQHAATDLLLCQDV